MCRRLLTVCLLCAGTVAAQEEGDEARALRASIESQGRAAAASILRQVREDLTKPRSSGWLTLRELLMEAGPETVAKPAGDSDCETLC